MDSNGVQCLVVQVNVCAVLLTRIIGKKVVMVIVVQVFRLRGGIENKIHEE